MQNKVGIILIFIALNLLITSPVFAAVPSAGDAANMADEIINRRLPFTFDCDFCHISGTAVDVSMPHRNSLEYHDKLVVEDTPGCFICHDFNRRSRLRLLSGELITFDESPRLCYQCHQKRYDTWYNGDHGKSGVRCTDFTCHDPHNPRLFKVSLGPGYPLPPPPDPPEPARFFGESNGEPYYEVVLFTGRIFIAVVVMVLIISGLMAIVYEKRT